jgi:hypothetical protein
MLHCVTGQDTYVVMSLMMDVLQQLAADAVSKGLKRAASCKVI